MNNKIRFLKNNLNALPWRLLSKFSNYQGNKIPVKFIIENADWAIKTVGMNIKNEIDKIYPEQIEITSKPHKVIKSIVHFGSQYMWLNWSNSISKDNQYITSFFHGKQEDGEEVRVHIDLFLKSLDKLKKVVTASSLVEDRLLKWGVPRNKLLKIPLGVDTKLFTLPIDNEKKCSRRSLGIPNHSLVIGSFQKDGTGWGDGLEPKFIKGPDLLISSIKLLHSWGYPVFVLLTGPARGYVKRELDNYGIPYLHKYPSNHSHLKSLYHALDIYLITSREEGGPMGLLESIACGTPVVSTNVGMVRDVIADKLTGGISERVEAECIAHKVEDIIKLSDIQKIELREKARQDICQFDWSIIAQEHWDKVYEPLINC